MPAQINWSRFENARKPICHCRCGKVFKSYVVSVRGNDGLKHITQTACPECGLTTEVHLVDPVPESDKIKE